MMRMPRVIAAVLLAASVMLPGSARAGAREELDKGVAAWLRSDYAEALRHSRPLAEQGYAGAQFFLGVMYGNGQGVPQDHAAAVKWYRLAAEQGVAEAQYNLGIAYYNGQGVPQDYAAAVRWYRLAAELGHAGAQYILGVAYGTGEGVPQDHAAAYMWFNLAAAQGDETAAKKRDMAAKQLTAAALESAQRLSRECLARNYQNC